jgi:hypothetical protein
MTYQQLGGHKAEGKLHLGGREQKRLHTTVLKLNSNNDKAVPRFRPFCIEGRVGASSPIRASLQVPFNIVISLTELAYQSLSKPSRRKTGTRMLITYGKSSHKRTS